MRPRPQPRTPTKAEVERHNLDHYPYASWCPACVDGAGRADKHVRGCEEQNEKPVIACDYGYFVDNDESPQTAGGEDASGETATPFLVTKVKQDKVVFADVVACKGVEDQFAVEQVYAHLKLLGYPEMLYRSDQENSIKAFLALVAARLRQDGIRVVQQQVPKGDSSSNVAETGVHQVKCKTRTLVSAARSLHGITIPRDHVCLPWAIKYAGQIICRSHKGADGRTAWSRCCLLYTSPSPRDVEECGMPGWG